MSHRARAGSPPGRAARPDLFSGGDEPSVASTPADLWQSASVLANPPANAVSFAVGVFLHKSTVDPLQVETDGLYVRPAGEIFTDFFEVEETCRWSTAAP